MTYYLPIKSTSLAHYFVCAMVKPAGLFDNKPKDIQDRFQGCLLLSTELGTNDTDCCMELVLTQDEEKNLIPCGKGFNLLPTPLPISRVKKVFFREQQQLELTLANINLSAAFVPHSLAEVRKFSKKGFDGDYKGDDKLVDNNYSRQLQLFDRILGALALMKTAKEPYMNYSENYASTLSFFNTLIRDELIRQGRPITDKFFGLFSRSESFRDSLPYLEKRITKEDLDQIAADNKQKIERPFTKVINLEKLSGKTRTFAILQSYGVGGEVAPKKIDSLISTNFEELKDGKAEGIALYYGYNRGYSVFSNSYGTEETKRQNVKYLLDSQLDYYTIESVYQFVFHANTISVGFPYIDEWCPKKNPVLKRKDDYIILDTAFISRKKSSVDSNEYLLGLLAEIKTFDILNISLSALIEQVRNRVAADTKKEIENATETKIAEVVEKYNAVQEVVNKRDEDIKSLKMGIVKLQQEKDRLQEMMVLLKGNFNRQYASVEEHDMLLREPGFENKSLSNNEELPLIAIPQMVDGSATKKNNRSSKPKSNSSRTKSKVSAKDQTRKETDPLLFDSHD